MSLQDLLHEIKKLKSRVDELETEKNQYERKLRATKVLLAPTNCILLLTCSTQFNYLNNKTLAVDGVLSQISSL